MSRFYNLEQAPFNSRSSARAIAAANNGLLFDPSDMSTMFQDAAGTIPVTAVEQPVGLVLDKSQGLMLGPELVTNGTFDSGISGWTQGNNITTTWANGAASMARSGVVDESLAFRQSVPVTQGKIYKVSFTSSGNSVARQIGGCTPAVGPAVAGIGSFSFVLTAATTSFLLNFWPTTDGTTAVIDNVSVRELYGNHATQSVTASRPVLSARYNLLTKTEDFSDAVWVKTNATVESSEILNPYGRNANKLIATQATGVHQIQQNGSMLLLNKSFTVCAKSGEYTQISVSISNNTYAANELVISLADGSVIRKGSSISSVEIKSHPDGWYSITVHYGQISDFKCSIGVVSGGATSFTGDGTSGLYVSCAQEEHNQAAIPYQRVNTATDYDTNPALFPKYLKFDGIDDYLNLPYMGLYGGGAASIIAARDAVSKSIDTYIISERSTTDADPKYFPSRQLANGGNMDAYISDDAAAVVLDTVGSAFGGAADKVIRSVVDTGSNIKLYKNGVLAADDNYTRAGTLTLNNTTIGASVSTTTGNYASMKLYGLIITKSALTDSQRVRCERFLARKAGVML